MNSIQMPPLEIVINTNVCWPEIVINTNTATCRTQILPHGTSFRGLINYARIQKSTTYLSIANSLDREREAIPGRTNIYL